MRGTARTSSQAAAFMRAEPLAAGCALVWIVLVATCGDARSAAVAARSACDTYASTDGADRQTGTLRAPYRSVARLVERTEAGQTACLLGGTFVGDVSIRRGGSPGRALTLTSAPGYRARILGVVYVADTADDVVISNLDLDGRNDHASPSPQINGDRVTLRGNDITNAHTAICVILGGSFERYGRPVGPVVTGNRIHDCGRLPPTRHDHGIYVEGTDGARIVDNLVYDNADWGIHLYPSAQRSYIAHNVVDGNGHGVLFASERARNEYSRAHAPDDNHVEHNVLSNSTIGYD